MTMTREKIESLKVLISNCKEGGVPSVYLPSGDVESLLALAERALEPQEQALPEPDEYACIDGVAQNVWAENSVRAYGRDCANRASQLALPAGPVPENVRHALNEWADAATSALQWLRNIGDGTTTDHQAAIENTLSGIQHAQKVTAAALAAPSPAVAQPVADERAEFDKWWNQFCAEHDEWQYADACALRWAAWQARAALCQPADEGGKS